VLATEAPTLVQWIDMFVREHSEAKGLQPSTIREQRSAFRRYVIPALGESTPIDKIGTPHFYQLRGALTDRKLAPSTVKNVMSVLRCATLFFYERQGIDAPTIKVPAVKVPKRPPKFWEPPQYRALVQAAHEQGPVAVAMILLMGDCGLRVGEVIALEWSHLRWQPKPQIVIQRSFTDGHFGPPKNGTPRTVPMSARVTAALRSLVRPIGDGLVFVRELDGQITNMTRSAVSWIVCKAERSAGLPGKHDDGQLHRLRHTFITRVAASGAPARVIQELAGHASIATTLHYMHVIPGAKDDAIAALERFDAQEFGHAEGKIWAAPVRLDTETGAEG
jgi:integrase